MMIFNNKMFSLFGNTKLKTKTLNAKLLHLMKDGFINKNGCYFLDTLYKKNKHITQEDFIDKTGYECFINSFHVDDYVNKNYVEQGYLFLKNLFEMWNLNNDALILIGLLSQTEFGANIKFYIKRKNEEWLKLQDVDEFEEPLLIMNSTLAL